MSKLLDRFRYFKQKGDSFAAVSYTHLRANETS